jgi:predicted Zn finger-like uncharacterized protein
MYTSCPECGTVFRISTTDLRVADGHVRCGHCSATFNALAALSDQPPSDTFPVLPPEPDVPTPPVDDETATRGDDDTLEFDIPEEKWSNFFKEHVLSQGRQEPVVAAMPAEPVVRPAADAESTEDPPELPATDPNGDDDWRELLDEVQDNDATDSVYIIEADTQDVPEASIPPDTTPWDERALDSVGPPAPLPVDFAADLTGNETVADTDLPVIGAGPGDTPDELAADRPFAWIPPSPADTAAPRYRWAYAAGSLLLAVALLTQLLHQRRDELATNPSLTAPLQQFYGILGIPLWPAWDLQAYEVRNYEAVADRSSRGALDILARIAVVGNERVGLPLVRITLSDRFGQTLGSRVFKPDEYRGGNPPPRELVSPGTLIPVEISLKDPGTDAQGFDVDICLMSQRDGMICQSEREPFAR